jgi:hypothetical protein
MLGGNGISDEYHVIRHAMNLEAVNTYEGMRGADNNMNACWAMWALEYCLGRTAMLYRTGRVGGVGWAWCTSGVVRSGALV